MVGIPCPVPPATRRCCYTAPPWLQLLDENEAAAAAADALPPSPSALDAEAAAAAEEPLTALSAEAVADALPEPAPKPATPAASEPEIVPAPRTPAASIVGGMRVAAASPKVGACGNAHCAVRCMLGRVWLKSVISSLHGACSVGVAVCSNCANSDVCFCLPPCLPAEEEAQPDAQGAEGVIAIGVG